MEEITFDTTGYGWHAIDIIITKRLVYEIGLLRVIWWADIWINGIPILKSLIAINMLAWLLMVIL